MEEIPETNDFEDLWDWLTKTLTKARDIHIPSKNFNDNMKKKHHKDHYDQHIIRKIKKKHKCWQSYIAKLILINRQDILVK